MSAWSCRSIDGKADQKIVPPRLRIPYWKGLGADSEEKHEPASDIDTALMDGLKALDPKRPIREDWVRFAKTSRPALSVSALPASEAGQLVAIVLVDEFHAADCRLFGVSGSFREPQTRTAAVLRYELDTSSFKRLNNSFDSAELRT